MKWIRPITIGLIALGACVEPFHANVPDGEKPLVVDGLISDQPGPYEVKVFRSNALSDANDTQDWVGGANVTLFDDAGNSEHLKEVAAGRYQTTTTQGQIGHSYYIRIELGDGLVYESLPEQLLPVGEFSNIRYEFVQPVAASDDDQLHPKNGFNIFLDADLDPGQHGLSRWRWTGTFEIETHPELRLKAVPGPIITWTPDPPACSGWVVPRGSKLAMQVGPCTCCFCWITQYNSTPLLSDKRFVANDIVRDVNIGFIPANKRYFYSKYYLDIDQMSVTPTAYEFWERVAKQQQQGSDLFQTPAGATIGNIQLVSGAGQKPIGLFTATSVKTHSFILYPANVPYRVNLIDTVAESCTTLYPYTTTTKPSFW
jgi:hypothetical protein